MLVRFSSCGLAADVPAGATLLDAARLAGVPMETPCDGSGRCGKCRVMVAAESRANLSSLCADASMGEEVSDEGVFLACHAVVRGDVEVESLLEESGGLRILSAGKGTAFDVSPAIRKVYGQSLDVTCVYLEDEVLGTEPGNTSDRCYGLAVDIGTTTVVATLLDLITGERLGTDSFLNPQTRYGHDVLSRIRFASEPRGLETLCSAIVSALTESLSGLAAKAGIEKEHIHELVLSGNTCMLHLAAGVNPRSLGRYPYTPALSGGISLPAADVGAGLPSHCRVYLPPVISGFVGGDITAGILATQLHREPGVVLFVDVGTNGEMVLSVDGRLSAASTAAGPAFEGMTIACGMRAVEGAIEAASLLDDGEVQLRTIGNAPPAGICGSGLLDLAAVCVAGGLVDRNGRFAKRNGSLSPLLLERLGARGGKSVFRLAESIYLTQKDVRQVQLAKGAVRAGIDILLSRNGLSYRDLDRVLIAGAFGFHLRTKSLTCIGMLPGEVEDKVEFVGNTSQAGAEAFLLNSAARLEMARLVEDIQVVELANVPEFEKTFINALAF